MLNFELVRFAHYELFNFEFSNILFFNSKFIIHQFKIAGVSREQFKTQNSKFKIANGNNSKLKTQNSKLDKIDYEQGRYNCDGSRRIT